MEGMFFLIFIFLTINKIVKKISELIENQTISFDNSYLRKEKILLIIMYLALIISGSLGYLKLLSQSTSLEYTATVLLIITMLSVGYIFMLKKLGIIKKLHIIDIIKHLITFILFLGSLEVYKSPVELIGFLYVVSNIIVIGFIKRVRCAVIENSVKIKECKNSCTEIYKTLLKVKI